MFETLYNWKTKRPFGHVGRKTRHRASERTEAERLPTHEPRGAVKGVARRVVIVREPDPQIFEQAIFVVREDYMNGGGVGASELLGEARNAAEGYVEKTLGSPVRRQRSGLRAAAYIAAGAGAAVMIWLGLCYFGIL